MSLTVRRENLPVRCEICHQTDLFDPETGNCMRCVAATVGAPLLRQDEAAINNPKPDVSIEWAKFQAFRKRFGPFIFLGMPMAAISLLVDDTALKLGLILLGLLAQLPMLALFRCPNCRFWIHNPEGTTCPSCGAILKSPESTPPQ